MTPKDNSVTQQKKNASYRYEKRNTVDEEELKRDTLPKKNTGQQISKQLSIKSSMQREKNRFITAGNMN